MSILNESADSPRIITLPLIWSETSRDAYSRGRPIVEKSHFLRLGKVLIGMYVEPQKEGGAVNARILTVYWAIDAYRFKTIEEAISRIEANADELFS